MNKKTESSVRASVFFVIYCEIKMVNNYILRNQSCTRPQSFSGELQPRRFRRTTE